MVSEGGQHRCKAAESASARGTSVSGGPHSASPAARGRSAVRRAAGMEPALLDLEAGIACWGEHGAGATAMPIGTLTNSTQR